MTKNRIKVLRIVTRLNVGGPARHAIILTENLNAPQNQKFRSYLAIGKIEDNEADMSYLYRKKSVHPITIPELYRGIHLWKDAVAFLKLFLIIRRIKPDIVHTHMSKVGTLGRVAAKFAGTPKIVHTYHGHIFSGYFGAISTKFFILINKVLNFFTTKIITISQAVKDEICNKYKIANPAKTEIIHLGIETRDYLNLDQCKGLLRRDLKAGEDDVLIAFVARLIPIKNCEMLLEVARKIVEKYKKVKFLIVGDGECKPEVEAYLEKFGLRDKILLLGWRDTLTEIYSDIDIAVLTSLNEGTPVSLIEAMLAGKPAVATNVGGVKDVITDNATGFLVPLNDVENFISKLSKLIENKALRVKMGQAAKKDILSRYDSKTLTQNMSDFYLKLVQKD